MSNLRHEHDETPQLIVNFEKRLRNFYIQPFALFFLPLSFLFICLFYPSLLRRHPSSALVSDLFIDPGDVQVRRPLLPAHKTPIKSSVFPADRLSRARAPPQRSRDHARPDSKRTLHPLPNFPKFPPPRAFRALLSPKRRVVFRFRLRFRLRFAAIESNSPNGIRFLARYFIRLERLVWFSTPFRTYRTCLDNKSPDPTLSTVFYPLTIHNS